MGCDIHMHVEKRTDGKWEHVWPPCHADPEYKEHWPSEPPDGVEIRPWSTKVFDEIWEHPFHFGRNYHIFAILAGVRNTDGSFLPISEPRGLPVDVSAVTKWESDDIGSDGHSHSHLSLKDLVGFDWEQKTVITRSVSIGGFKEYLEKGAPSSWCGWSSGEYISNEEMLAVCRIKEYEGPRVNTMLTWRVTYSDFCSALLEDVLPELEKLGEPEDVRIVFWFDN